MIGPRAGQLLVGVPARGDRHRPRPAPPARLDVAPGVPHHPAEDLRAVSLRPQQGLSPAEARLDKLGAVGRVAAEAAEGEEGVQAGPLELDAGALLDVPGPEAEGDAPAAGRCARARRGFREGGESPGTRAPCAPGIRGRGPTVNYTPRVFPSGRGAPERAPRRSPCPSSRGGKRSASNRGRRKGRGRPLRGRGRPPLRSGGGFRPRRTNDVHREDMPVDSQKAAAEKKTVRFAGCPPP